MRTLVLVQAHRGAQETLRMLAPHYLSAGADLVGVDEADSVVDCWPGCFKMACSVDAGRPMVHPKRLAEVVKLALGSRYDRFVFTEYDALILKTVPDTPPHAFSACIVGQAPKDWDVGSLPILKPPFIATRLVMETWLRAAESLIAAKKFGNWSSAIFAAMCCNKSMIPLYGLSEVHSLNGTRNASDIVVARQRVTEGIWHLHGVKRADHLCFILKQSDAIPPDAIMQ